MDDCVPGTSKEYIDFHSQPSPMDDAEFKSNEEISDNIPEISIQNESSYCVENEITGLKGSLENMLIINDTLQVLAKELLEHISNETLTIKTLSEYLNHQLYQANSTNPESVISQDVDMIGVCDLFRRSSFFISSENETPPPNSDYQDRTKRGEFNIFSMLRFMKMGNVLLKKNEIIKVVGEEKRGQLLSRLNDDLQRLKTSMNEAKELGQTNLDYYSSNIHDINQEMNSLKDLSSLNLANLIYAQDEIEKIDWLKLSLHKFKSILSDTNLRLGWMHYIGPHINSRAWSSTEDSQLVALVEEVGEHAWEEVAERLGTGRSPVICLQRWQRKLNKTPRWTTEEDELLRDVVSTATSSPDWKGKLSWCSISSHFPGKNASHCCSRWSHINPNTRQGPWTENQDIQLLLSVQRFGIQEWTRISAVIPGRRPRLCQDRYHQLMESVQPWNYKEDKRLWLLLMEFKEKTIIRHNQFRALLPYFSGRTTKSMSSRWQLLKSCKSRLDKLDNFVQLFLKRQMSSSKGSDKSCKIDDHIVYSPLVKNVIANMMREGIEKPEEKIFEMIATWSTENNPNREFDDYKEMLKDLQNGLVIPRPYLVNQLTHLQASTSISSLDHVVNLRRVMSTKCLLEEAIRNQLSTILSSKCLNDVKKKKAYELMSNESSFWIAYEKVCQLGDMQERLYHYRRLSAIQSIVPIFVEKMLRVKLPSKVKEEASVLQPTNQSEEEDVEEDTEHESDRLNIEIKSDSHSEMDTVEDNRFCPNVGQFKLMKLVELKRLLEEREKIYVWPSGHGKRKIYKEEEVFRHLPESMCRHFTDKRILSSNTKRVRGMLSDALASNQDAIILRSPKTSQQQEEKLKLPVLPLNQATTLGFKTLLLERRKLTMSGLEAVKQMFKVTQRPELDIEKELQFLLNEGINMEVARRVTENQSAMQQFMFSDSFKLLRSRFLALFAWPALTSTLLWSSITEKREEYFLQLQEKYEEEIRERSSTALECKPVMKKCVYLANQGREIRHFKDLFVKPSLKRKHKKNTDFDYSDSDEDFMYEPGAKFPHYSDQSNVAHNSANRLERSSKLQAVNAIRNCINESSDFETRDERMCEPSSDSASLSFQLDSGWIVTIPRDILTFLSAGFELESFTHRSSYLENVSYFPTLNDSH